MKSIRTQDAVGHALLHDLVRIVIGEVKIRRSAVVMLLQKRIFLNY